MQLEHSTPLLTPTRATPPSFARRSTAVLVASLLGVVACSEERRPPEGAAGTLGNAGGPGDGGAGTGPIGGGQAPLPAECAPSGDLPRLRLTPIASDLTRPVFATAAPGDAERLYILEQPGRVRVLENGEVKDEPFLDLVERVTSEGNEQGLLGLAFHPEYASNGRLFLHYSSRGGDGIDSGDGVIAEFRRSESDPTRGDPNSERRLLVVEQPFSNHNGGMLAFSPRDGYLYIGLGDGGSGNDPMGAGQNLSTLLGKMLRIDVDAAEGGRSYAIPPGNMTGGGARAEIWSYGWRNPWRFSFDACTGDLYAGDVGQNAIEELDFEPAGVSGRNYGWKILEGTRCRPGGGDCDPSGTTLPVHEYPRSFGCSVTGGYVYRGAAIPGLRGYYLYADYCTGRFGRFRIENGAAVDVAEITEDINPDEINSISSFGEDAAREMLVVGHGGTVYRIEAE